MCLAPKASGLAVFLVPDDPAHSCAGLMPSAVELTTYDPAGRGREKQGRQDSNPRHPVLETGALTWLSYTPI